jgi:hypothetical protein
MLTSVLATVSVDAYNYSHSSERRLNGRGQLIRNPQISQTARYSVKNIYPFNCFKTHQISVS